MFFTFDTSSIGLCSDFIVVLPASFLTLVITDRHKLDLVLLIRSTFFIHKKKINVVAQIDKNQVDINIINKFENTQLRMLFTFCLFWF